MDETTHDARGPETAELPAAPRGMLSALDELLRQPERLVRRAQRRETAYLLWLTLGAVLCFALYGLASGFFQGGAQILVTAFKVPLIILASMALCLPSFYVFSALAGVDVSPRWIATALVGLAGMLGLLMVALMPVTWLFSVSSRSLSFIVMLHFGIWLVAIGFATRFLAIASHERGGRAFVAWTFLFLFVSLQVASQMRPVLFRPDGMALFAPQKMFFLQHLGYLLGDGEEIPAEETAAR